MARIKNNPVLDRRAAPYLKLPPGRRPQQPRVWFYEMSYQAQLWSRARRVILVVLERSGELIPDHFWLLTSWTRPQRSAEVLLELYRQRGTAEGHQGELKSVGSRFMGCAIGHKAWIGAGLYVQHGRAIPNGTRLIRDPSEVVKKFADVPPGTLLIARDGAAVPLKPT